MPVGHGTLFCLSDFWSECPQHEHSPEASLLSAPQVQASLHNACRSRISSRNQSASSWVDPEERRISSANPSSAASVASHPMSAEAPEAAFSISAGAAESGPGPSGPKPDNTLLPRTAIAIAATNAAI